MVACARAGPLVDSFEAEFVGRLEGRLDVVGFEGQMVEPGATPVEESGNRPVAVDGLEELEFGSGSVEKDETESVEALLVGDRETEEVVEQCDQAVGVVGRQADVVQVHPARASRVGRHNRSVPRLAGEPEFADGASRTKWAGVKPRPVPDTKDTREKKGRVKERQLLEADIEDAVEAAGTQPETPLEGAEDDEELELSFEE